MYTSGSCRFLLFSVAYIVYVAQEIAGYEDTDT
jgi:hypothetical protein